MDEQEKKAPAPAALAEPAGSAESAAPAEQPPAGSPRKDRSQRNAFENFYEHFRGVPLKYIDIFIGICAVALVAVVAAGIINR